MFRSDLGFGRRVETYPSRSISDQHSGSLAEMLLKFRRCTTDEDEDHPVVGTHLPYLALITPVTNS